MNSYGAKDLARQFRVVRGNTIKIAEEIDEKNYDFQPTKETRTVRQLLTHIATLPRFNTRLHGTEKATTLAGYDFGSVMGPLMAEEQKPRTKAEIIELLKTEGEKYATQLESCTEEFLGEIVQYPEGMTPPTKSRFEMLIAAKEHEMHHRAQLMVAQRLLGQTPHLTRQMMERVAAMAAAHKA